MGKPFAVIGINDNGFSIEEICYPHGPVTIMDDVPICDRVQMILVIASKGPIQKEPAPTRLLCLLGGFSVWVEIEDYF